jgi:chemotaxis protein CheX
METRYEDLIQEIVQNIFATMLNIELVRDVTPPPSDEEHLLAAVQITGEWVGSAILALSPELASTTASVMLGTPAGSAHEDDLRDVAAELVNMIGGNLKSLLPAPSYLSLPTVFTARDFDLQVRQALLIEDLSLVGESGSLRVRLYAKIPRLEPAVA